VTNRWNPNDLETIAAAEELAVAPMGPDGNLRSYRTIWVVRVGDNLCVRSYRGSAGGWYRAAQRSHQGRIRAGGGERDVRFEHPEGVEPSVDDAYRAKYGRCGYVDTMLGPDAAGTTLRIVPR
jgi:hypothetical protein